MANVSAGYVFTSAQDPITFSKLNLLGNPTVTIGAGEITPAMISAAAWASPGAIGSTTPNTGAFTTLTATGPIRSTGTYGFAIGDAGSSVARMLYGADAATTFSLINAANSYGAFNIGNLGVTGTFASTGVGAIGTTTSATTTLNLPAGTTGVATIRLAHGVAPSAPVDGDMWTTTSGLYVRINGSTVGPLS